MKDGEFMEAMEGVRQLPQTAADIGKRKVDRSEAAKRKRHAESFVVNDSHALSIFNKKRVLPHDIVGFKRPGVQEGVYRQFRLGKYGFDARLDLHGFTVDGAAEALYQFIQESMAYELRTVIVVHGKGDRDEGEKALLKNYSLQWLSEMTEVLAYHSARPQDGGVGALYVLLKKSERAKQKSRDQFRLRE